MVNPNWRLIEHDAVIELFNHVIEAADKQGWLSGEHFSVDGTLIQAWAGHKSFVRKDGSDEPGSGGSFKGQTRGNETHQSSTDADARLYRKGKTGSDCSFFCLKIRYYFLESADVFEFSSPRGRRTPARAAQ